MAARTEAKEAEATLKTLAERAKEIHGKVPSATQRRTTIAVTETEEGIRVVSSSEKRVRTAQRRALQAGEVEGKGVHAKTTGVNAAKQMGLTPTETAASRPICEGCAGSLADQGVRLASPLKKVRGIKE